MTSTLDGRSPDRREFAPVERAPVEDQELAPPTRATTQAPATTDEPVSAPRSQASLATTAIAARAAADPAAAAQRLGNLGVTTRSAVVRALQTGAGNGSVQRLVVGAIGTRGGAGIGEGSWPAGDVDAGAAVADSAEAIVPGLGGVAGGGTAGPPASDGSGDGAPPAIPRGGQPAPRRPSSGPTGANPSVMTVQRHDDPPAHAHPHPGTWTTLDIGSDIIGLLDDMPSFLDRVHSLRPAPVRGREQAAPEGIANPTVAAIVAQDRMIFTDRVGAPTEVRDFGSEMPVELNTAFLVEFNRGFVWQLGTRNNRIEAIPSDLTSSRMPHAEAGDAGLYVYLPSAVADVPSIMPEVRRRIRASDLARRRAAGPAPWARAQGQRLQDRLTQRAGASGGTGGEGPGLGSQGHGTGGGGTGETGEAGTGGTGGGTGTGDRTTPTPPTPPTTDQASRPRPTGADSIQVTVDGNGDPVCRVTADRATTTIPMHQGESDDDLVSRADAAGDALRADRSGSASVRLQGGATTTGFTPGTAGQVIPPEQAREQAATGGGETPGERPQGTGDANTPAWPSSIRVYGMQPPQAPITVRGATNDFTMEIDRGSDAFNYFQTINFYWELIRVDGMSPQDRQRASAMTGVGAGEHVSRGSGDWQDIVRDHQAIAEDVHNEDWLTIAAEYQLIGLSAAVRSLGSVVSAFFAAVTRPLNEQAIGFDTDGDFILRCVATPIVDREWLERHGIPRERQTIRASSVATVPVRVPASRPVPSRSTAARRTRSRPSGATSRPPGRPAGPRRRSTSSSATSRRWSPATRWTRRPTCPRRSPSSSTCSPCSTSLMLAERDNVPLETRSADILELDVGLRFANLTRQDFRTQTQGQLNAKPGAARDRPDVGRRFQPCFPAPRHVRVRGQRADHPDGGDAR